MPSHTPSMKYSCKHQVRMQFFSSSYVLFSCRHHSHTPHSLTTHHHQHNSPPLITPTYHHDHDHDHHHPPTHRPYHHHHHSPPSPTTITHPPTTTTTTGNGMYLHLFPVWSKVNPSHDAAFVRLRAKVGFIVSAQYSGAHQAVSNVVQITATVTRTCTVLSPWPDTATVNVTDAATGDQVALTWSGGGSGRWFSFPAIGGNDYLVVATSLVEHDIV
jgi:hypothetical protein